jgi:hypothetical protein
MQMLHLVFLFLLFAGVAYLMMFAGVKKSALEWKRPTRACSSCGRHANRDCRCRRSP